MPSVCFLCTEPTLKNTNSRLSFHVFPTCPKRRQVWINRCKLTNREILPNHKICSFHFEPTCFKSNLKRRILYSDAVPTIFEKRYFKKKYRLSRIMKGGIVGSKRNTRSIKSAEETSGCLKNLTSSQNMLLDGNIKTLKDEKLYFMLQLELVQIATTKKNIK